MVRLLLKKNTTKEHNERAKKVSKLRKGEEIMFGEQANSICKLATSSCSKVENDAMFKCFSLHNFPLYPSLADLLLPCISTVYWLLA
jgi:hypothetical protein